MQKKIEKSDRDKKALKIVKTFRKQPKKKNAERKEQLKIASKT